MRQGVGVQRADDRSDVQDSRARLTYGPRGMHIAAHIAVPDAAEACVCYANALGARELTRISLPGAAARAIGSD